MAEKLPDNLGPMDEHEQQEQAFHDHMVFSLYALDYYYADSQPEFDCGFVPEDSPELFEENNMRYMSVDVAADGNVVAARVYHTDDDKLRNDKYEYNIFDRTLTLDSTLENSNDTTYELEVLLDDLDEKAMECEDGMNAAFEQMEQTLRSRPDYNDFFESYDQQNELLSEQRRQMFNGEVSAESIDEMAERDHALQAVLLGKFDAFSQEQPGFAELLETYRTSLLHMRIVEGQMDEVEEQLEREKNVTDVDVDKSDATIRDECAWLLDAAVELSKQHDETTQD